MRLEYRIVFFSFALSGCVTQATEQETPFEFGKLRATLNGSDFVGAFGRDSVIAIWDTLSGSMQIEGNKQVRGHGPSVRVQMKCTALPKPGTYAIKNPFSPVSAEAFLGASALERLWPVHGRRIHAFLSDSMPPGSLVLDTVDTVNRIIRGRFAGALRSVNRTAAETLYVRAAFFGRLRIEPSFARPPFGPWSPLFDRDCGRIRNAVSM